ncbi:MULTISPECIES: MHYT domain-containing protein [unclassified Solwaraspora]|uniref:MHYT domain-containing protein n=1 Tax=unclassified Solwaraspora TaxID=2627926 RepID=UPI00259AFFB0|nr:MHYT domain-containing protein [Solwaraspora sp. WMMA2056]WJK38986.1 MHYT domain-containing protein [Solwaraspora sp. WMMA2056]
MAEINHFEYGFITPTLSYALSVLGSFLGLICAVRVRESNTPGRRAWWLVLAAFAIGGTAIWTMHFMAMLGFSVAGTQIRYDIAITIASAVIAIAAVGLGLFLVGFGRPSLVKILSGGVLTGLGVAAMHYTGMAAMRLNGDIGYDAGRVALSVVIAVVAATVALWLAVTVRRPLAMTGSALLMGVAVNGMHFTGMTAMSVHLHEPTGLLSGATAATLLVPIGVAVLLVVIGLVYAVLSAPTEEDRAAAAYLDARIAQRRSAPPPAPARPTGFTPLRSGSAAGTGDRDSSSGSGGFNGFQA